MTPCTFGFRIVGSVGEPRRLVDAAAALAGYAACDQRAEVDREAYLSAFQFSAEMARQIDHFGNGSTAGYVGLVWSPWIWFDIDRDSLDGALRDARRLAASIDQRYRLDDDSLLVFFSGSKGFHIGLPTALWSPEPSPTFHRACRRLAETIADAAGVSIDAGVYDAVRAFRAPNSRHPKTGLHKRRLSLDELLNLSLQRSVELARGPASFDLPEPCGTTSEAVADWQAAVEQVAKRDEAKAARRAAGNGAPTLNRATVEFMRDGAGNGDRHRLLFSAAANLAEFGCPPALAHALLSQSALDSGLPPKDVRRQIECGLAAAGEAQAPSAAIEAIDNPPAASVVPPPESQTDLAARLCALWGSEQPPAVSPTPVAQSLPAEPPPCESHSDPAGWLDTPAADRPGWIRSTCRRCGAFVGCRRDAENAGME